ncbi:MAG: class II fructose-bisphosphate aldolase [Kiritimatiellae bacterium]|nr:class II fructose-bisphosphate aldolase [Kiritimatiellia bacterium]
MLVDIREILADARTKRYGVCSTSPVFSLAIPPIIQACEEKRSPIILSVTENQMPYDDIDNVGPELVRYAHKTEIPVALILDHGKTMETVTRAIRMGFNAIMFDGSDLPLEENIRQTAEISRMAHHFGLAMEGELGSIGGKEGKTIEARDAGYVYTEPETARRFVEETGVDILAVAIGNIHGVTAFEPQLDFERLRAIRDTLDIPLGMHGASGISDADMKACITNGISKVNFYSTMSRNMVVAARQLIASDDKFVNFPLLVNAAQEAACETIRQCCDLYGSAGKIRSNGQRH